MWPFKWAFGGMGATGDFEHFVDRRQHLVNHALQRGVNHGARSFVS